MTDTDDRQPGVRSSPSLTYGRATAAPAWEYECQLCGYQWRTLDGLWGHVPRHGLTQAQYGTLVDAERIVKERDAALARADGLALANAALRADRDADDRGCPFPDAVHFARAECEQLLARREALRSEITTLTADLDAALARADGLALTNAALRAAFVKHRTATHETKPTFCVTCRESDAVLAAAPDTGGDGKELT